MDKKIRTKISPLSQAVHAYFLIPYAIAVSPVFAAHTQQAGV